MVWQSAQNCLFPFQNSSTSSITSEDFSSEYTSETDHSGSDIDEEDLDLELVVSPVDIPEFFEEIYKKKPKKRRRKKLRKPLSPPSSEARVEFHHNKPQLPTYRAVRTVRNVITEPLYRQAFHRVQAQELRNPQRSNRRVKVVRRVNSFKGQSVHAGAVGYTAQVYCDGKPIYFIKLLWQISYPRNYLLSSYSRNVCRSFICQFDFFQPNWTLFDKGY